MKKSLLLLPVLMLLFSQCCYKEECAFDVPQGFDIDIKAAPAADGFSRTDLNFFVLFSIDKNTRQATDTFHLINHSIPAADTIFKVWLYEKEVRNTTGKSIREQDFVLYNLQNGFSDTLVNFNFISQAEKYTCGSCWFSSNEQTIMAIRNRSVEYHGLKYDEKQWPPVIAKH